MNAVQTHISVGPANADVIGLDNRAIQLAIDALAWRGGGTVRVLAGEYVLSDAVRLRPNITLLGERDKTLFRRAPAAVSRLAVDADVAQQEIAPIDAASFAPGMGVCLYDEKSGWAFPGRPYIVSRVEQQVLQLNGILTEERYAENNGIVVNYFPLILAHNADHVVVDGVTLDGTVNAVGSRTALEIFERARPTLRTALICYTHCQHAVMRNVVARNGLGDGICVNDASVGARVENCEAANNQWYGIHPGSHSAHCAIRHCNIHHNGSDGLYICWGIHHSIFEDNEIHHNGWRQVRSGISIGHKDTDNLLARNHVYENYKFGVCFRAKTEANGAHRNILRENLIENNGVRAGELPDVAQHLQAWETVACGVHVSGITRDLLLEKNIIRESRNGDAATQRHGLVLRRGVTGTRLEANVFSGHPGEAIVDEARDKKTSPALETAKS